MTIENPDELERVDQEIRINELKAEAEELVGGEMFTMESEDTPPDVAEQFWRNVVEYESAELITDRGKLARDGLVLPPPAEVAEDDLPALLAEMFERLAKRRTYVYHTDHVGDGELYEKLWRETLNEEHPDVEYGTHGGWFIDILGGCSQEDIYLSHKYYADEEERRDWMERWPEDEMPEHEDPPYDRDRHLPRPPQIPGGPQWF